MFQFYLPSEKKTKHFQSCLNISCNRNGSSKKPLQDTGRAFVKLDGVNAVFFPGDGLIGGRENSCFCRHFQASDFVSRQGCFCTEQLPPSDKEMKTSRFVRPICRLL